jgi:uncharacterized membrane protein
VGLAHGPAAGAVIGTLRAFYCLYGDTVNTAARMCKSAPPGHIHCTETFSVLVAEAGTVCKGICSHDRGIKEIKGKGAMRIYELSYVEKDVHMPVRNRGSVTSSKDFQEVPIDFHALALESQAVWLRDPARKIDPPLCKFADQSLEGVFQDMAAPGQRRLLSLGLVLNALATALEWRMGGMTTLLAVHWGVSCAVCATLLFLLWRRAWRACDRGGVDGAASTTIHRLFALQLVAHMCLCSVASRSVAATSPHWSWLLDFSTGACIITAWMGQPSVRNATALGSVALVTFFIGLAAQPIIAPRATDAALILSLAIGMVGSLHRLGGAEANRELFLAQARVVLASAVSHHSCPTFADGPVGGIEPRPAFAVPRAAFLRGAVGAAAAPAARPLAAARRLGDDQHLGSPSAGDLPRGCPSARHMRVHRPLADHLAHAGTS